MGPHHPAPPPQKKRRKARCASHFVSNKFLCKFVCILLSALLIQTYAVGGPPNLFFLWAQKLLKPAVIMFVETGNAPDRVFNFDFLLTLHLSIFILVVNQLDAQNFRFTISLFHASTCFEHHGIITLVSV